MIMQRHITVKLALGLLSHSVASFIMDKLILPYMRPKCGPLDVMAGHHGNQLVAMSGCLKYKET